MPKTVLLGGAPPNCLVNLHRQTLALLCIEAQLCFRSCKLHPEVKSREKSDNAFLKCNLVAGSLAEERDGVVGGGGHGGGTNVG